jgi:hypothetical protein
MSLMFTEHCEASILPYLFFWLRDSNIWFFTQAQIIVQDRKAEILSPELLNEQVMMKRRDIGKQLSEDKSWRARHACRAVGQVRVEMVMLTWKNTRGTVFLTCKSILVSKVTGTFIWKPQLPASGRRYFPAGNLGGAPKPRTITTHRRIWKRNKSAIFMEVPWVL